jgi:hypothetical protein
MISIFVDNVLALSWAMLLAPSIAFVLTSTYVITSMKSYLERRETKVGREPPGIPYWIPFVGNLFEFFKDTRGYMTKVTSVHRRMPCDQKPPGN